VAGAVRFVVRVVDSRPCETSAEVAAIVREYVAAHPEDTLLTGLSVWDYAAGQELPVVRSPLEFLSAHAEDSSRSTRPRECARSESCETP
jgi:hypothetical protein